MAYISWDELNELACEWYKLVQEESHPEKKDYSGQIQKLKQQIWVGLMVLYPDSSSELIEEFMTKTFIKFDPAKAPFEHFARNRMKYLYLDFTNKGLYTGQADKRIVPLTVEDENGDIKERWDLPSTDTIEVDIIEKDHSDFVLTSLLALIINLKLRLPGKTNNEDAFRYYCMFFTDSITQELQECADLVPYLNKERDILTALRHDEYRFMDFFLTTKCRNIREIAVSSVKLLGELVKGEEMKKPRRPLPADVYITFLREVYDIMRSRQAISNHRSAYYKLIEKEIPL